MEQNRRNLLKVGASGFAIIPIAACANLGKSTPSVTEASAAGTTTASAIQTGVSGVQKAVATVTAAIPTTVSKAQNFWAQVLGGAEQITKLLVETSPEYQTITSLISVGTEAVAALPTIASDAEAVASKVSTIVATGVQLLDAYAGKISIIPNAAAVSAG